MSKINLLPREISELIAAGEVVERPASVVKELIENSIDAGADRITVEINRGGTQMIRITDNGCGIAADEVETAFLRHATSKIKVRDDLDSIGTLGFRGEALAATSAVSRIEMFTKTAEEPFGTRFVIEGGVPTLKEEAGCPDGTTIVVRDIFYNTPARMKFLKKDTSEGNAVSAVLERAALSHPEIAFRLIRDGKQTLITSGDGELKGAIYSVLGRELANSLIAAEGEENGVKVNGFVCKPIFCKATRAGQYTFLNGRLVRSGTVMAAVEQAYKNSAMVGKFPAFVLNVQVPFETVDVNVHPAKTEVRFADEKRIFEAVYRTVRAALTAGDTRPEITLAKKQGKFFDSMSAAEYRQQGISLKDDLAAAKKAEPKLLVFNQDPTPIAEREDVKRYVAEARSPEKTEEKPFAAPKKADALIEKTPDEQPQPAAPVAEESTPEPSPEREYSPKEEVAFIGEAFSTYIVVSRGDSIFLIDKHAAHERINFNNLKAQVTPEAQALLVPVAVRLDDKQYSAALQNVGLLARAGFEIEDFGNLTVMVRAVPMALLGADVEQTLSEAAESLSLKGLVEIERLDRIFHTVACKAAIKAGSTNSRAELLALATRVLEDDDIRYCPHGRPVAFEITRRELEKQFGRIQ